MPRKDREKQRSSKEEKEAEAKNREQEGRDGRRSQGHENGKCLRPTGKVLVVRENQVCL